MESPDHKEEKYVFNEQKVKFFTFWKLIRLFFIIIISLFGIFGLLLFINVTLFPELGFIELAVNARSKTDIWKTSKQRDLGHEAVAFENMLDAYALQGGDISHSLDTLTDEFTAANWAELLEYDVDYFLKHDEVSDSIKFNGMLHVSKLLYTSGHYDLFKQSYKILKNRFASDEDFLVIYSELIGLKADYSYDDEEEKKELQILYELELRRHLKLTANQIVMDLNAGNLESEELKTFISNIKMAFETDNVLAERSQSFRDQVEEDMVQILALIKEMAQNTSDQSLLDASKELTQIMVDMGMPSAASLAQSYS